MTSITDTAPVPATRTEEGVPRQTRKAAAVLALACTARRERNPRPLPARRCRAIRELVVQHLADSAHRVAITRVRVPRYERVDERRIEERRVVLPVDAAKCLAVEDGIVEIDLGPGARVARDVSLDELPAEA